MFLFRFVVLCSCRMSDRSPVLVGTSNCIVPRRCAVTWHLHLQNKHLSNNIYEVVIDKEGCMTLGHSNWTMNSLLDTALWVSPWFESFYSNRKQTNSLGNQSRRGKIFLSAEKSCVTSADATRGRPIAILILLSIVPVRRERTSERWQPPLGSTELGLMSIRY